MSEDVGFNLDHRFLCSDGACIGTIAANGNCKVCGKEIAETDREAFERAFGDGATNLKGDSVPEPGQDESQDEADEETVAASDDASTEAAKDDAAKDDAATAEEKDGDSSSGATFDPAARELCPDGACIGLIGADGRCKECGRQRGDSPS